MGKKGARKTTYARKQIGKYLNISWWIYAHICVCIDFIWRKQFLYKLAFYSDEIFQYCKYWLTGIIHVCSAGHLRSGAVTLEACVWSAEVVAQSRTSTLHASTFLANFKYKVQCLQNLLALLNNFTDIKFQCGCSSFTLYGLYKNMCFKKY